MSCFTDEQAALTLALLAYRGFADVEWGAGHAHALRRDLCAALEGFEPLQRSWELVWGPATFRPALGLVDSTAAYVVRSRHDPALYVVAIRGTNPVSVFDWVFGDFWSLRLTPWRWGRRNAPLAAAVSLSTALGLATLRSVRAPDPGATEGVLAHIGDRARDLVSASGRLVERATAPLGVMPMARRIRRLGSELAVQVADLASALPGARGAPGALTSTLAGAVPERAALGRLAAAWRAGRWHPLIEALGTAFDGADAHAQMTLLAALEQDAAARGHTTAGVGLLEFLSAAARSLTSLEVMVTGHSKGGALASAAAVWLADTQGSSGVPEPERWDPQRKATVHCYSFAGPTAGNAGFAAHAAAALGRRYHRIANQLDLVPRAWAAPSLLDALDLYRPAVDDPPGLGELAALIAERVDGLAYQHVTGQERVFRGRLAADARTYPEQLVHQHLEAYIEELGLAPWLTRRRLFGVG